MFEGEIVMQIVSASQFVDGLMAALYLQGRQELNLDDPAIDRQFALAYDDLLEKAEELNLVPDFVITADPTYGDSTCLRDAILDIRDSRSVSLNNPRFVRMSLKFAGLNTPDAVLNENTVPRAFLEDLARQHLSTISG
jgi:hypothetical protein